MIRLLLIHGQYLLMDTANNKSTLMNQASCSSVHLLILCIRQGKNKIVSQIEAKLLWLLKFKIHCLKPEFLFEPV